MSAIIEKAYADPALVLAEYLELENTLLGASLLYPETAKRIYIESLPKDTQTTSCLVIKQVGGKPRVAAPLINARLEIDCYGSGDNPETARKIARLLAAQLHRARNEVLTSGVLLTAVVNGGGTIIWTPPNVRPFVPVYCDTQIRAS